jgi:inner membrane protein
MASIFGHGLAAIAVGNTYNKKITTWKFWLLGVLCAMFPDADVIGFKFGITYESFWGHRGFTHSLLFALLIGIIITIIFFNKKLSTVKGLAYISFFTLCTASHSLLDAMTTGGLGVAFFSPFDDSRYFFPWRPIQVSPIGIKNFFGEWGIRVILSELIWIGIPCTAYIVLMRFLKPIKKD